MASAAESFVLELARVSRRGNRYLSRLGAADRDDILQIALVWCWENRSTYDLTVPLDQWFAGAVRNAKKSFYVNERNQMAPIMDAPECAVEDPVIAAEALEAATLLAKALTPTERKAAALKAQGHSWRKIRKTLMIGDERLNVIKVKVSRLNELVPESSEVSRVLLAQKSARAPTRSSDDQAGPGPRIDQELAQLDFPPPVGSPECPPCWRCKYFEGYLPGDHRSVRVMIEEPEVRDSVARIESRKIEIATRVRDGSIGFTGNGRDL
jgi:DNA-directed RNA polymerase specialized sigma24 family protein